jgi:hypothetical protein
MTSSIHVRDVPTSKFSFWNDWGLPAVVAVVLTPFALVAHQYKFVNDDQILYIPFLRRKMESSLYAGDYFFDQPQAGISLFEDALVWPVRWLGIEWTMPGKTVSLTTSGLRCDGAFYSTYQHRGYFRQDLRQLLQPTHSHAAFGLVNFDRALGATPLVGSGYRQSAPVTSSSVRSAHLVGDEFAGSLVGVERD